MTAEQPMTDADLARLLPGDVIRHRMSGRASVVLYTLDDGTAIASQTTHVSYAVEWVKVAEVKYEDGWR